MFFLLRKYHEKLHQVTFIGDDKKIPRVEPQESLARVTPELNNPPPCQVKWCLSKDSDDNECGKNNHSNIYAKRILIKVK